MSQWIEDGHTVTAYMQQDWIGLRATCPFIEDGRYIGPATFDVTGGSPDPTESEPPPCCSQTPKGLGCYVQEQISDLGAEAIDHEGKPFGSTAWLVIEAMPIRWRTDNPWSADVEFWWQPTVDRLEVP